MKICYVHGAGASERSFIWLQEQLLPDSANFFAYSVNEPLASSITRLLEFIDKTNSDVLIGHSLGGVMAAACANSNNIKKIVTLNAPFGGMRYAEFMYMFSLEQLFYDMRTHGPILSSIRANYINKPHLAIVGTKGLPFTSEANDGVITVASQTALIGPHYELVPLNHFEVLLSKEVIQLLIDFLKG